MSEEKNTTASETPPKVQKGHPVSASKKATEKVIYLGPTLIDVDFVLTSNTIYSNGLPSDMAERVKSDTDLARLFVPVGKAALVMNKLADSNSDLSATAKKLKNKYLNKRKEAR
jgi:hypothetical protein